eukprot:m.84034 g.84034  ORF g.84034 m.84034 type:complete len:112 (+) comp14785_c1_seq1:827-1162(+)
MASRSASEKPNSDDEAPGWPCPVCTFRNPDKKLLCQICQSKRSTSSRRRVAALPVDSLLEQQRLLETAKKRKSVVSRQSSVQPLATSVSANGTDITITAFKTDKLLKNYNS